MITEQELRDYFGDVKIYMAGVRSMLKVKGYSEGTLAQRAGVHPSQLSRWLNGHGEPNLLSLIRIDEAVNEL
jgi:transcriptional regulator with XRE-family HTH domain